MGIFKNEREVAYGVVTEMSGITTSISFFDGVMAPGAYLFDVEVNKANYTVRVTEGDERHDLKLSVEEQMDKYWFPRIGQEVAITRPVLKILGFPIKGRHRLVL